MPVCPPGKTGWYRPILSYFRYDLRDLTQLAAQRSKSVNVMKSDVIKNFQLPFSAQNFLERRHGFTALNR